MAAYTLLLLVEFHTPRYLGIAVGILCSIDQWRTAWGLTAIIKCLLRLGNQMTMVAQTGFLSYMTFYNAYALWLRIETLLDQESSSSAPSELNPLDSVIDSQVERLLVLAYLGVFLSAWATYLHSVYSFCLGEEVVDSEESTVDKKES